MARATHRGSRRAARGWSACAIFAAALGAVAAPVCPAYAEDCIRAQRAVAGAVVPCTGELLPSATVKSLLIVHEHRELLLAELDAERELAEAEQQRLRARLDTSERLRVEAEQDVATLAAAPRRGWVVPTLIGAALGAALTLAVVEATR